MKKIIFLLVFLIVLFSNVANVCAADEHSGLWLDLGLVLNSVSPIEPTGVGTEYIELDRYYTSTGYNQITAIYNIAGTELGFGFGYDPDGQSIGLGLGFAEAGYEMINGISPETWYHINIVIYNGNSTAVITVDDVVGSIRVETFGGDLDNSLGFSFADGGSVDNYFHTDEFGNPLIGETFDSEPLYGSFWGGGVISDGSSPPVLPVIDTWTNNLTSDATLTIYPDVDESIIFGTTYDPVATSYTWLKNTVDQSNNNAGFTTSFTVGTHTLETYGTTGAGDSASTIWTIEVAAPLPTVTMESPTNTTYYLYPLWFNVTATDASGIDTCQYSLDGIANVTMSNDTATHFYTMITTLSDGEHNITYNCNNTGGYTNNTPYEYFTFDPMAQFPANVNVSINSTRVYTGLGNLTTFVDLSVADEINTFLDNCVEDVDGYCSVPIETEYVETGKLSLGDISVSYNFPDAKTQARISNEGLLDTTLNTIRATANDGTFCEFTPSYTNLTVGDFLTVSNTTCLINCNNFLSFRVTTTCGTSDEFLGTPNGC